MQIELRKPEFVMRLDRLGSFHQSKLSFLRSFIREFKDWEFETKELELDENGFGHCVYVVTKDNKQYCIGTTVFKSQRVDGSQMLIEGLEALGISDQSKPLGAVDAVVITTTRTDTGIQAKVLEINNKSALRALAPKAIALFGFLFDIADVLTFTAVSKPVEKGHTNRSVRSIKDPAMA